jgi:transcriptional regulator
LSEMYRPPAYAIDDIAILHTTIRTRVFATIAAIVEGAVRFAYAPVALDTDAGTRGGVRFHLARGNPLAELDGVHVRLSFLGPDAYISPDWYVSRAMVPTWNYIAIEGEGIARRLDDGALRQLLVDLSAVAEDRLLPKAPWTIDKISEERVAMLLKAIRGFTVSLDTLEGKFKLSQDKSEADLAGAIAGLEARGDPASLAVAAAMRERSVERK